MKGWDAMRRGRNYQYRIVSEAGLRPSAEPRGRHGRLPRLLSDLTFPLYVVQGMWTRLRTPRLSPPPGRTGGRFAGHGAEISLLVIGDSTVHGIGTERQDDTLTPSIARRLRDMTARPVRWRANGFNGSVMREITDYVVPNIPHGGWSHVLLSVGHNDAKNFHSRRRFERDLTRLIFAVKARFPDARIYWGSLLDFRKMPNLPEPLATIMDLRADTLSRIGWKVCREQGVTVLPAIDLVLPDHFSCDGFHAGPVGYNVWARHIAECLARSEFAPPRPQPVRDEEMATDDAGERPAVPSL
ncbi:SGNH/GDSL hydrolase family protein [Notoacmeibacter ruber]|uniref:SGNH/GDSL hydrolase family protein n=1 Tax=Notoacmeibacter ruber TaxID=2670375 RepID=A0A3L7JD98_9HYPH|nr:SGNH/GDSL hydrolase family protein [Notoacmeibacter ruber]RLQ88727.1 SGNH/GDSL hydrolase family protein [Notoacmeibacter ruber]